MPPSAEHYISSDTVHLRRIDIGDADDHAELMSDSEVMRYVGLEAGHVMSAAEAREIVEGAVRAWQTRGYGRWSIFENQTNNFVGFSGFRCENGVPELISIVHKRFWGRGHAFEAATTCIRYAFSHLGFKRVCAFSRPTNARARGLLRKLGAECVGTVDFHGVEGVEFNIPRPRDI